MVVFFSFLLVIKTSQKKKKEWTGDYKDCSLSITLLRDPLAYLSKQNVYRHAIHVSLLPFGIIKARSRSTATAEDEKDHVNPPCHVS